ncbi:Bro-N domain-containing protein [Salmonella enterica]|uniref:Bro-N domain-containing protein n=2 Tax=Salmonella enterica TaxID=28901 RepID=A0A744CQI3_SALER|nr:Bro-N domain-containing protein [Salmonella enterica]EBP4060647.1 Bro-N domain-containing protein [Salmonella enterica subsp. enterica]ECG7483337.1 Bro-N domain-containing protein [Salmonella enterica subsp. enterica serovar Monschaui]ECK0661749.1 Bro-N domain-containing protein [Salmonella enterica subsp. enterica serovar Cotham]EDI0748918.1 hypothetical protein [Salmonella enterica subsp. enterica serovar Kisarawe]AXD41487.1 hypothetical protein CHD70_03645 [Salmonella enterica]
MKKINALNGQGLAQPEIGQIINCRELKFHGQTVVPYDNGDGKIWVTAKQAAKLLGYANARSVTNLYNSNADEFTPSMSQVIVTVTSGKSKGCGNLKTKTRIFSLRGLHLLGMLAETPVAKELRKWVLNLIDGETATQFPDLTGLSFASMKELSVKQITDFLVKAEEYSKRENGTKGSLKMHRRKKEKKAIENAERAAKQFINFTLGLEFDDGVVCV